MSLLFESIKYADGRFFLLPYHEQRMNRARRQLLGLHTAITLSDLQAPSGLMPGVVYKCRITYQETITGITFTPYMHKQVNQLKCVTDNQILYNYKYEDRRRIRHLYDQRGEAGDIIIVKNGMVTDSAYTNLAFYSKGKWFTPETPLLEGTKRAFYLEQQLLIPVPIPVEDIHGYEAVCRINAFMDLSLQEAVPVKNILIS